LGPAALAAGLRRRWTWIVGLPVAVLLASFVGYDPPAARVAAHISFAIDVPATALVPGSDEGTAAKIGEALIDDMSRIVGGDRFAAAVAARLPRGVALAPGDVASSLAADDRHRVADLSVTRTVPPPGDAAARDRAAAEALTVAEAVVAELEARGGTWFTYLGAERIGLTVIDGPRVAELPAPLRVRLERPLRVTLALVVALGLAGAAHLADRRLHDEVAAAAAAGAAVLARIPRAGRRRGARRA